MIFKEINAKNVVRQWKIVYNVQIFICNRNFNIFGN